MHVLPPSVRRHTRRHVICVMYLHGHCSSDANEFDAERDWQDGEARSWKVDQEGCGDGEVDRVVVVDVDFGALSESSLSDMYQHDG